LAVDSNDAAAAASKMKEQSPSRPVARALSRSLLTARRLGL
jgi:hypothetical protein